MINLLQVDDDPIFNAVCMKHFGGRQDVQFTQFETTAEAERRLSAEPAIDVFMLDLSLPDRDGIEFLPLIRQLGFEGQLILVSSQPRSVIDMAATLAGSLGLNLAMTLDKPLTPEKLAKIDEVVAGKG